MTVGITVGKFYPLHQGHIYMLEQAAKRVDKLYILSVWDYEEIPSWKYRVKWLEELHLGEVIVVENLRGEEENSAMWADYARTVLAEHGFTGEIDYAFGSEEYTHTWAKELGAEAVLIDSDRTKFFISGTEIRNHPQVYWGFLSPGAKEYYCDRICVIGGESTGKSTLVRKLADWFSTLYTPEVGRFFVEAWPTTYNEDDAIWKSIISDQYAVENFLARQCPIPLLFCDTDLMTTSVWHERWEPDKIEMQLRIENAFDQQFGARSSLLPYDMYLLCNDDVEYVQDGSRTEAEFRKWFHDRLKAKATSTGVPVVEITGSDFDDRFDQASTVITNWMLHG